MIGPRLRVAVVGHTNTGKTSLMRTLMRDVDFGEVSDRPAVTQDVQAVLMRAGEEDMLELFDTPGLEDSIGLLELLDKIRGDRRVDFIDVIDEFLRSPEAKGRFAQEAKAIRQLLASDVALYVIDVRDRVLGKHRDELEILGRCARPIVPVLNFTAAENAKTSLWREHLARANMHATAEFDTVVFDERDEQRLFEKMRSLLDEHRDTLDRLGADRREQRRALVRSSARILAELLVEVAAFAVAVPANQKNRSAATMENFKAAVRQREQRGVEDLLALHRFRPTDVQGTGLPIEDGEWGLDLFSRAALKQFGLHAGGAAATGAMVGLTADIMFAGLSLGTGAVAGAAVGGLLGTIRAQGRRLFDRARGLTELRCDDATLRLLAARQIALVHVLLRRGHASFDAIRLDDQAGSEKALTIPRAVMRILAETRVHPEWSGLVAAGGIGPGGGRVGADGPAGANANADARTGTGADPARHEIVQALALEIDELLVDGRSARSKTGA